MKNFFKLKKIFNTVLLKKQLSISTLCDSKNQAASPSFKVINEFYNVASPSGEQSRRDPYSVFPKFRTYTQSKT